MIVQERTSWLDSISENSHGRDEMQVDSMDAHIGVISDNRKLSPNALGVKVCLERQESIITILRETSAGVEYDFHWIPPMIPGLKLRPDTLVAALRELKSFGIVVGSSVVAKFDSSKYTETWQLAA